jgi:hypothetical protein
MDVGPRQLQPCLTHAQCRCDVAGIAEGFGQRERLLRMAQAVQPIIDRLGHAPTADEHRRVFLDAAPDTRQVQILVQPPLPLQDPQASGRQNVVGRVRRAEVVVVILKVVFAGRLPVRRLPTERPKQRRIVPALIRSRGGSVEGVINTVVTDLGGPLLELLRQRAPLWEGQISGEDSLGPGRAELRRTRPPRRRSRRAWSNPGRTPP